MSVVLIYTRMEKPEKDVEVIHHYNAYLSPDLKEQIINEIPDLNKEDIVEVSIVVKVKKYKKK
jgi:hypothetical protein